MFNLPSLPWLCRTNEVPCQDSQCCPSRQAENSNPRILKHATCAGLGSPSSKHARGARLQLHGLCQVAAGPSLSFICSRWFKCQILCRICRVPGHVWVKLRTRWPGTSQMSLVQLPCRFETVRGVFWLCLLGSKTPSSFYECDAAAHVDITSLQSKSRGCCRLVCWPNLQPLLRFYGCRRSCKVSRHDCAILLPKHSKTKGRSSFKAIGTVGAWM